MNHKTRTRILLTMALAALLAISGGLITNAMMRGSDPEPVWVELCDMSNPPTCRWVDTTPTPPTEEQTGPMKMRRFVPDETGQLVEISADRPRSQP